ncbi:hypothetical protein M404DRAFT_33662 [Pisolithus tinctorius Marx 270]|uniref:Retrotransposon gag domain-containing protein n=1 Tax=Pisolithus tinctorius Marx 270 TaxID=870435 RepID=A0A0C3IG62_PISTI|nr:hypothetical protein M404DRAFT_33662 [Pisolithus tinctorius Marx 270]
MAEELTHQTSGLNLQDPFTGQSRVTPEMAAKFYKSLFSRDVVRPKGPSQEAYINENTTALGDLKIFDGWDKFVTKLKETFQVGDTRSTPLIYLSAICQGDCLLNKYITNFCNCLNKAQISTEDLTAAVFFGKGLNEEINKWILMAGPKPDTIKDWIWQATAAHAVMATLKVSLEKQLIKTAPIYGNKNNLLMDQSLIHL